MINILHIMTRLPVGGVENQLLTVLKQYDREKYAPIVCSLSDKGQIGMEIENEGIEVICINKLRHTFDWSIIRDLYRIIKERNIHVVRTHQYHANFYGRIAAIIAKVPCIIASVHNIYTRDRKLHRRLLNKILGKLTDRVIAVSSAVKEDIVRYDGLREEKIMVINNGIDQGLFVGHDRNGSREEIGIPVDANVIGTVGRLTHQKGQKYLIEAFALVKKKDPKLKLVIAGDGDMRSELEDITRSLGLVHDVLFLGMRRDVPRILSVIDIFVLPSLREGLVNALLEAMAAGKPVIASDIKPIREIIDSSDVGKLVPVGDSSKLAASIEELLNNHSIMEKMGRAAKEHAASVFSIASTIADYTQLFEETLRSKGWNV
jgi:glycosyltransferase involved in cell wall biosynthesis